MKKVIIIFFCLCLTSCKPVELEKSSALSNYTSFNTTVVDEDNIAYLDVAFEGETISYSILNHQGEVETGIVYELDENCLEKFINIANFINRDMEYNLLVFVNYKQVEFKVEDKEYNVFNVLIQKNASLQIPIKIDSLDPGFNDILFLIVPDANQNLTDVSAEEFYGETLSLRCNAILGADGAIKKLNSLKLMNIKEMQHDISILDKSDNNYSDLESCNLPTNTQKQLFIGVRNKNDYDEDFVLILLNNWEQISLGGKNFELVTLESDSVGAFPVQVSFNKEGTNRLVAIAIKAPYQNYDFSSMNIESSQWIDVNISE